MLQSDKNKQNYYFEVNENFVKFLYFKKCYDQMQNLFS